MFRMTAVAAPRKKLSREGLIPIIWAIIVLGLISVAIYLNYVVFRNAFNQVCWINERSCPFKVDEINKLLSPWTDPVDDRVNPCDDFYDHACGYFSLNQQISFWSKIFLFKHFTPFDSIEKQTIKCRTDALFSNKTTHLRAVQMMKTYINALLQDKEGRKLYEKETFLREINSFGGCPFVNADWNEDSFNLTKSLHRMTELTGETFLLRMDVEKPFPTSKIVPVMKFQISKYYRHKDIVDFYKYFAWLNNKLDYATYQTMFATLKNVISEQDEFYYKVLIEKESSNSTEVESFNFNELDQLIPLLDSRYFLENPIVSPEFRSFLSTNPTLYIKAKQSMPELNSFFSSYNASEFVNYLCVAYVEHQMSYMNVDKEPPKAEVQITEEQIVNYISEKIPLSFLAAHDYVFLQECVDPKKLEITKEIANNVQHTLKYIGGASGSNSLEALEREYRLLDISTNDSYREMGRKLRVFVAQSNLDIVYGPAHSIDYYTFPVAHMNAANLIHWNTIQITGGWINTRMPNANAPSPMHYGSVGSIVGHELGHSFDPSGIEYGLRGANKTFFTNTSKLEYRKRTECFVKQFNGVFDDQIYAYLNGEKTLNENIADHIGLQVAFDAYRRASNNKTTKMNYAYGNFTNDQLFFLGLARQFCSKSTYYTVSHLASSDVHSLNKHRINERLKNFPPFSDAFNCPKESPMNPRAKCALY